MSDTTTELLGALQRAADACEISATLLRSTPVAPEALAEYTAPRRGFLRTKPATMSPIGEVWRIGPLLLAAQPLAGDPQLFAAGRATRSAERGRPSYQSNSREERREVAAAALRGGYPLGTPVNFGATPLPLTPESDWHSDDTGPLGFAHGEIRVRWSAGAALTTAPTLAEFLADRTCLLTDPPQGAN